VSQGDFIAAAFSGASPEEAKYAFTELTRLAHRVPDGPAREWLRARLAADLATLAEPALEVAMETEGPIGPVLAELLAQVNSNDIIERLADRLPEDTLGLREVALVVTTRRLTAARSRFIADPDGASDALLSALLSQAKRLFDLGRFDEALRAAMEAVELCRHSGKAEALRRHSVRSRHNSSVWDSMSRRSKRQPRRLSCAHRGSGHRAPPLHSRNWWIA